jgi:integrase
MSIERLERDGGVVWRVRWRENGRNRSKVLGRKRDAEAFDAEVRRRKRTGELSELDAGKQTLAEFAEEWWRVHVQPNLAASTKKDYASTWDRHVLPALGGMQLRHINVEVVHRFAADLAEREVGPVARRKVLTILGGVLQHAVEWGRIPANPARVVRKPSARPNRQVRPLPPATVERMRAHLLARGRVRDATLVSVLAYAGLRPGEAIGLRWEDVGERALLVARSVYDGAIKQTKTGTRRSVRLLEPLKDDLTAWREAAKPTHDSQLVFPAADGDPWHEHDWRNWRRRAFVPAAEAAGLSDARPYDLRHSFVSLLIHEGRSIVEVAAQAGHAPSMTLSTYAHVMAELDGADRLGAEDAIRTARAEHVPVLYLAAPEPTDRSSKTPVLPRAAERTRTADPFITSEVLYQLSYGGGSRPSLASARPAQPAGPRCAARYSRTIRLHSSTRRWSPCGSCRERPDAEAVAEFDGDLHGGTRRGSTAGRRRRRCRRPSGTRDASHRCAAWWSSARAE